MSKVVLELSNMPGDCNECVLSTYKVYPNEQGLYCAAFINRVSCEQIKCGYTKCPLKIIEE